MEYYFDILCLVTLYKDEKRYVEIYCQSPLRHRSCRRRSSHPLDAPSFEQQVLSYYAMLE